MNISDLWDHADPAASEARFRTALVGAGPDEALILHAQIARTYGLRRQFGPAQEVLRGVRQHLDGAGTEAQAHFWLEWGRSFCSAAHAPATQTENDRQAAREAYTRAFGLARDARLDHLAIDALHMMVCVDPAPEQALEWNFRALAYMRASSDPEARLWAASLHHNLGCTLHQLGRFDEALEQFRLALAARERRGGVPEVRIAHWMIAWTLRSLNRPVEAMAIQQRLEREWDADGRPDPYVYQELAALYASVGDTDRAVLYQEKCK